jgi:hypothetical protein
MPTKAPTAQEASFAAPHASPLYVVIVILFSIVVSL